MRTREQIVLHHIVRGVNSKEIGILMGCSRLAIRGFLYRMRKEAGCRNNVELVIGAITVGMIEMPEEWEVVNPFRARELRERRG